MADKKLTTAQVEALFPDRSFSVLRVERGPYKGRSFVWVASWYAGYFTSDTDRHVVNANVSRKQFFAESPDEALWLMVHDELKCARDRVMAERDNLGKALEVLDLANERLAPVLGVEPLDG